MGVEQILNIAVGLFSTTMVIIIFITGNRD